MDDVKKIKLCFGVILYCCLLVDVSHCRKHHLKLDVDNRSKFTLSSFGFLKRGTLMVNLTRFSFSESVDRLDNKTFGFTLDMSSNPGAGGYMEDYTEKCILHDMSGNPGNVKDDILSIVFMRMDLKKKKMYIERRGKSLKNLIITTEPLDEFLSSHKMQRREAGLGFESPVSDTSLFSRSRRAEDKPPQPKVVPVATDPPIESTTDSPGSETGKADQVLTEIPIYQLNNKRIEEFTTYFLVAVTHEAEEGMYNLNFHNCLNFGDNGGKESTTISLTMDIIEDNDGNFLSAGEIPIPVLYFLLAAVYMVCGGVWMWSLRQSTESVYKMHYLMFAVVIVKSFACLFHAMNHHFIQKKGIHEEAWAVLFYIAYLMRGALLFITIILIGSGWAFIKHVLSDREKKLFLIIIPLQILDNIAWIIVEESEEGQSQYGVWKEIFILIDLVCCGAILFPVVWSIRHLHEASKADGKAAISLNKLKLFRQFYIMVVCYIYFTRIIVYLLQMTMPFRYEWLNELFREMATVMFFIVTGYKFRPASDNPYLQLFREMATVMFFIVTGYKFRPASDNPYLQVPLDSDDEEDIEMDEVVTKSASLDTVKRVNQNGGNNDDTSGLKVRESSHEYD